jgi:hypothetical protein
MTDIATSQWSETAASNNASPPDGFPEGQTAASLNNSAREMMAAIKREWNRDHPTITAGGTADALTLTYTTAPVALVNGMRFQFMSASINATTAPTLDINGLGAKTITEIDGSALSPGQILADQIVTVVYNSATLEFRLVYTAPFTNGVRTFYQPSLFREEFGASATVNGVKTISFVTTFSTIYNVQLTVYGQVGTGTLQTVYASLPSSTGMVVYGAATDSLGFYWRVYGEA